MIRSLLNHDQEEQRQENKGEKHKIKMKTRNKDAYKIIESGGRNQHDEEQNKNKRNKCNN